MPLEGMLRSPLAKPSCSARTQPCSVTSSFWIPVLGPSSLAGLCRDALLSTLLGPDYCVASPLLCSLRSENSDADRQTDRFLKERSRSAKDKGASQRLLGVRKLRVYRAGALCTHRYRLQQLSKKHIHFVPRSGCHIALQGPRPHSGCSDRM